MIEYGYRLFKDKKKITDWVRPLKALKYNKDDLCFSLLKNQKLFL